MRTQPTAPVHKLWRFLLAGLAYAALSVMAYPPSALWPIALLAPLPLVWAGCRSRGRPIRAGLLAGLGTLPFWIMGHMYLVQVTAEGYPALCVYLALYPMIFVAALDILLRMFARTPAAILAPLAWCGLELIRGEIVFTGYPWYLAGQPLIDVPFLAAPAAVGSVYLVSFLVLGLCGAAADAAGWSGRRRSGGGLAAGIWASLWLALALIGSLWPSPPTQSVRVAVVQTNLPQDNKVSWPIASKVADFRRFMELTRKAALSVPTPDVILWPETMFPGLALNADAVEEINRRVGPYELETPVQINEGEAVSFLDRDYFYRELVALHKDLGVPLMVGGLAREMWQLDRPYNSAFVIQNGGVDPARYDKMDLTPFGEVIPYVWRWPELQQRVLSLGAGGMSFDLLAGQEPKVLTLGLKRSGSASTSTSVTAAPASAASTASPTPAAPSSVRLAAPICFEGTKPATCRRLAMGAAQGPAAAFINLSNDGWFSDYTGREMHLQCARWRCVEMGLPMVRAVNTGISAVIDSRGRLTAVGPTPAERPDRVDGVLIADVPMVTPGSNTIFSRAGFVPVLVLLGLLAGLVPACQWSGRKRDTSVSRAMSA